MGDNALRSALAAAGRILVEAAGAADDDLVKADDGRDKDSQDEGADRTPGGKKEDDPSNAPVPEIAASDDPKSLFFDPFAVVEQLGFKDKPTNISYGTLKAITWKMPVITAVIQTRIGQVAAFSHPQRNRYDVGYKVKLRDASKEPTGADKKWAQQMESLLQRTGVTENPRGRDNFEKFLRKLTWDALVYDQTCIEVVPNRKGQPAEWYAVDGSTIRLADAASTFIDEDDQKAIRYVQIYDGMVIAEYTQEELFFGVRNPRSDIRLHGYGVSELEMLVGTITSMLWSWQYNQKFFSQGSAQKGLLNIKGAISEKQLRMFRRHWYQNLSGVENAWRTPIMNSDDVQWVNLQNSNRDMEFSAWMDFLIKVACSMYNMDPIEVNFQYGNVGQKSALKESNNKEKITESKERGLRPLLRFMAEALNQSVIWPLNENFELVFVGLDSATHDEVLDRNTKAVKTTRTIDELRAEDDLPPLKDGLGEVILDPTWLQFYQQKQGGGGEEGGPGGFGDEGDDGEIDFESLLGGGEDEEAKNEAAQAGKPPPGGATKPGQPGQAAAPAKPAKPSQEQQQKSLSPLIRVDFEV